MSPKEELWKKAHAAYNKMLRADLEAAKTEKKLMSLLKDLQIIPPASFRSWYGDEWKKTMKSVAQETKKLLNMNLTEFKERMIIYI